MQDEHAYATALDALHSPAHAADAPANAWLRWLGDRSSGCIAERGPEAGLSENERWHIREAIDSFRVTREGCCLDPRVCTRCDAYCGDLSQP